MIHRITLLTSIPKNGCWLYILL